MRLSILLITIIIVFAGATALISSMVSLGVLYNATLPSDYVANFSKVSETNEYVSSIFGTYTGGTNISNPTSAEKASNSLGLFKDIPAKISGTGNFVQSALGIDPVWYALFFGILGVVIVAGLITFFTQREV